jgi:uncharacterized membrane protein YbhN (UPF0104 family)
MSLDTTTSAKYRSLSPARARNVFLLRAGIARTFGGLGSFLAVIFLGGGIYLLQESFTDPLRAQALGLIAGAFIMALATILIYFIFTPRKRLLSEKVRRIEVRMPVRSLAARRLRRYRQRENAKSRANTIASA